MKNLNFASKALLTLGAFFVFAAPTLAQTTPAPTAPATPIKHAKHEARLPKWLAEVSLTPEQTEKVHAIQKAGAAQGKAVRDDAKLTEDQKKDKLRDIKKDTRTQILALLTPEQKAKVKAEHKEKMKEEPVAPKN